MVGISWRLVKKEVLDRRNVIKKKLGLIYAYDSTMNLGYDDDAKTFSVFTRGVKKWTQRTVMSGVVQGKNHGDWKQWYVWNPFMLPKTLLSETLRNGYFILT